MEETVDRLIININTNTDYSDKDMDGIEPFENSDWKGMFRHIVTFSISS
jgi:hypothetical protein